MSRFSWGLTGEYSSNCHRMGQAWEISNTRSMSRHPHIFRQLFDANETVFAIEIRPRRVDDIAIFRQFDRPIFRASDTFNGQVIAVNIPVNSPDKPVKSSKYKTPKLRV
jgi:hypothetical protein